MSKSKQGHRSGFTLIEVLIATVITLLMMAALAQGFKRLADSMSAGRSKLTLVDKLRSVTAILRNDLENCTVRPVPPLEAINGSGYFEYYDGALTDYSAAFYGFDSTATGTETIALSRYGDVDDILMFTARSKGEPFKGRVPLAILKQSRGQAIVATDWDPVNAVTIASEYAEIIYFVLPVPSADAIDTGVFMLPSGIPNFEPIRTDYPRRYNLFRRVLLIRPDLNVAVNAGGITYPALFFDANLPLTGKVFANQTDPAPTRMALAHQNCDISIRKVPGNNSLVAANSLEDLTRRENRFAHFTIPGVPTSPATSMPVLSLTAHLPHAISVGGANTDARTVAFVSSNTAPALTGFLRPEFALGGVRVGEDILLSGTIGFDIKGFDPLVQCLLHPGADATDGGGVIGTDDVIVTPSDPGYAARIVDTSVAAAYTGEFVDLCWGLKTASLLRYRGGSAGGGAVDTARWVTPLSGLSAVPSTSSMQWPVSTSLLKSGVISRNVPGEPPIVFQPTYDSWCMNYESDNQLIAYSNSLPYWKDGMGYFGYNTSGVTPDPTAGIGANGVDNSSPLDGFIDDEGEHETSPPFPVPMQAIRIEVRAEDDGTRILEQMSVVHEFASH